MSKLFDDFWSHVDKTGDCWLWTRSVTSHGYGQVWDGRKIRLAHRLAWELTHGPIPPHQSHRGSLCVCHACDTPRCCNPAHLFLGSQRDNLADMRRKRRGFPGFKEQPLRGERNANASLTADAVVAIRLGYATGESLRALARRHNVWHTTIADIVHRRTWREIS